MTRGKYSAKAANRMAQLDNELLTEAQNSIRLLQEQIVELSTTLETERQNRNSHITRRTKELVAQELAAAKAVADSVREKLLSDMRKVADRLTRYFTTAARTYPPDWFDQILPLLRPDLSTKDFSSYIEDCVTA